MTQPAYPAAAREDIVDDLFGHRVADPYRWLEDAVDRPDRRVARLPGRSCAALPRRPARAASGCGRALTELLGTGVIGGPAWRGERYFFVRRDPGQEHAAVLVREADGTERMLIDPAALDPSGKTTLDSWQPDKEGRLLAYQLSVGGDEESSLLVLDVDIGAVVDGPLARTRYSPVAWLPGGEQYYYVRRLAPEDVPADEAMYHHRVYLHQVGDSPDDDVMVFGEGMDKTSYYGVSVSRDGRWLTLTAHPRHRPAQRRLAGRHLLGQPDNPALQVVQLDVDACTSIHVGNDGRLYVFTDRDAPRGRLCVTDPHDAGVRDLAGADRRGPRGRARRLRDPRRAVLRPSRAHTRHAVERAHRPRPRDRRPPALRRAARASARSAGVGARPEGGTEAWFG